MNIEDLLALVSYEASGLIMLDMKLRCERCDTPLPENEVAYICSFECTFCATCTRWFQTRCPNCSSELVRRPRRTREAREEDLVLI